MDLEFAVGSGNASTHRVKVPVMTNRLSLGVLGYGPMLSIKIVSHGCCGSCPFRPARGCQMLVLQRAQEMQRRASDCPFFRFFPSGVSCGGVVVERPDNDLLDVYGDE